MKTTFNQTKILSLGVFKTYRFFLVYQIFAALVNSELHLFFAGRLSSCYQFLITVVIAAVDSVFVSCADQKKVLGEFHALFVHEGVVDD